MAELRVPDWKISLDIPVYRKIRNYSKAAAGEWSGLGVFTMTPSGPLVTSLYLLEQVSSQADTEIDEAAAGKLAFDLASAGLPCDLNVWVHSHGTMNTFWSSKDEKDGIGQMLNAPPFLVSIVTNKAGDLLGRIDVNTPFRVTLNKVPVVVEMGLDEAQYALDAAEIQQKVSPPYSSRTTRPSLPALRGNSGSAWGSDYLKGYDFGWDDEPVIGAGASDTPGLDAIPHVWGLSKDSQDLGWIPVSSPDEAAQLYQSGQITEVALAYLEEVFSEALLFDASAREDPQRLSGQAFGVDKETPTTQDLDDLDLTEVASGRFWRR